MGDVAVQEDSRTTVFGEPEGIAVSSRDHRLFWDPVSGCFDGPQLRLVIVRRGWTVEEFAALATISRACAYGALAGRPLRQKTAALVHRALRLPS